MKKTYVIGNWKSNKNISQAREWLDEFSDKLKTKNYEFESIEVIICPSFIHLWLFHEFIVKNNLPIKLGMQDVSPFETGAYTGAVSGSMVKDLVSYTIIGHSERRKHFGENEKILEEKVRQSKSAGIEPIFCVQDENTPVPNGVSIVAYEPVWAIGTGESDSPENANEVCKKIYEKTKADVLIYGGSVKQDNVASFIGKEHIDGVLPGGASLKPESFLAIIDNARSSNQA